MRALVLAAVLAVASPALASAPTEPVKEGHVDIDPFAVPVIAGGRVVNYVFVTLRLHTPPTADVDALKAKEPRIREALVRAAHRTPLNGPTRRSELDEAGLAAVALAEARRLGGPKAFTRAEVLRQVPQRRLADAAPR